MCSSDLSNSISNHTPLSSSDASEAVGRSACPTAAVPPSCPEAEVETVLVNQPNPLGNDQVGSVVAGLAANPSVGCPSSDPDPLAVTDLDKSIKDEDLLTEEELQEHERWANDFTSGLRSALGPDTPPGCLGPKSIYLVL